MKKIIVLIGYPGAGKTTLAKAFIEKHPGFILHDVYEYIKQYKNDDGALKDESLAIKAYEEMYADLEKMDNDLILELGTNYPEANAKKLKALAEKRDITVFLCLLSTKECYQRVKDSGQLFEEEALKRRLEREFPEEHEGFLKKSSLPYHYLQMGQSMDDQIKTVEEIINE
ncbi:ATP-binding protein [Patescibacteria group bacterium]|nr:ATP-binding protein [Patescibacteria group bacterium]